MSPRLIRTELIHWTETTGDGKDKNDPIRTVDHLSTADGRVLLSFDNWSRESFVDRDVLERLIKVDEG